MEFTQVLDCLVVGLPVAFFALVFVDTLTGVFSLWEKQVIKYAPESQPVNYFPVIEEAPEVENVEIQIPSIEEDELEVLLQKEVKSWFDAISEADSVLENELVTPEAIREYPSCGIAPTPKRGRGRPKKEVVAAPAPKRGRGRPRKAIPSNGVEAIP